MRHFHEHGVSGVVAPGVIDDLELVEVRKQHRYLTMLPGGPGQTFLQSLDERGAVEQAGKRVVTGCMGQLGHDDPICEQ